MSETKSIAVPVTRKRAPAKSSKTKLAAKAAAAAEAAASTPLPLVLRRFATPVRGPVRHRFAVGDRVLVGPRTGSIPRAPGAYIIIAALPAESGPLQYRVRNEGEPYERVVVESDISELDV